MDDERVLHPVTQAQLSANAAAADVVPPHSPATRSDDGGGGGGGGGVSRSIRTHPPADYISKIQNFPLYLDAARELHLGDFETGAFEAGGYRWKLQFYHDGDRDLQGDARGHISLYLIVADRTVLPAGWEINVNFRFFLYNQKEDHYLTFQDIDEGRVTRFNQMRTESGFAKIMSHDELMDDANGYLMDDSIVIGAEVFVIGNKRRLESLSAMWGPSAGVVACKLSDFFKQCCRPRPYVIFAWERKWKLEAYIEEIGPGLHGEEYAHLKINLTLLNNNAGKYFHDFNMIMRYWFQKEERVDDEFVPQSGDVYAEWKVRVRNQRDEAQHINNEGRSWFRPDSRKRGSWSCTNVILLSDLTDESKGYVVHDTLIIDVAFDLIREVKNTTLRCMSQFTLYGILKGNKPDFHVAMSPDHAKPFYASLVEKFQKAYKSDAVKNGIFGAMMKVNLVNDGPVRNDDAA